MEKYNEIQNLIIRWCNDGTKTAGSLTRCIEALLDGTKLKNPKDGEFEQNYGKFITIKVPEKPKEANKFFKDIKEVEDRYGK